MGSPHLDHLEKDVGSGWRTEEGKYLKRRRLLRRRKATDWTSRVLFSGLFQTAAVKPVQTTLLNFLWPLISLPTNRTNPVLRHWRKVNHGVGLYHLKKSLVLILKYKREKWFSWPLFLNLYLILQIMRRCLAAAACDIDFSLKFGDTCGRKSFISNSN